MNQTVRKGFFWTLTIIFLCTTPLLILYFIGYRYNAERGIFIYTGSITIQSNPFQDLNILIDNKPVTTETNQINQSYHIGGITPGKHTISVSAPDFSTWSKEVTVRSGLSTEFWNVLLPRKQYEKTNIHVPNGSIAFFPSPNGNSILFVSRENDETLLTLFDKNTGIFRQIFSSKELLFNVALTKKSILWSPNNEKAILVPLQDQENNSRIFLIDTDTLKTIDLRDIIRTSEDSIRNARWSPIDQSILFLTGTTLFSISTTAPFQHTTISTDVDNYDIVRDTIIALESDTGILFQVPIAQPADRIQITTTAPDHLPQINHTSETLEEFPSVITYDETRIILEYPKTGDIFLYNNGNKETSFKKISSNVKGVQFSNDGKKLLYWTDWEIFTLFTRKWTAQPIREENERADIGRFSTTIKNVQWARDYEHVLFTVDNDIKIIELDNRGGRNLLNVTSSPTPLIDMQSIGSQNQILLLRTQHPQNPSKNTIIFSSIAFPEQVNFFNFRN